jgi:hypothetical protein
MAHFQTSSVLRHATSSLHTYFPSEHYQKLVARICIPGSGYILWCTQQPI